MTKIFYDHLINIEEVIIELDQNDISIEERSEFISIIDETLHHHILDTILSNLPFEHHENFLTKFHKAPHDPDLIIYLKQVSGPDIEEKIKTKANEVKKEIISEIKKSKKK